MRIAKVIGVDDMDAYCEKFSQQVTVPQYFIEKRQNWQKKPWDKFVTSTNEVLIDESVFDLLTKMLAFDHTKRPTAVEAIAHPYFDAIRKEYEHELI